MLSVDRHKYIMEYLNVHETVTRGELSERLGVTSMTVGRDLKKLEEQGMLVLTHGGAMLPNLAEERLYTRKKGEHMNVKKRIAKEAMCGIHNGMTILLDAGTTTFEIADLLRNSNLSNLTVITVDLYIALHLYQCSNIKLIILGGEILAETGAATGVMAIKQLEQFNADIAFMGTAAITDDYYLSVPTERKVFLKKMMRQVSAKTVLVADQSKFGRKKLYKSVRLDAFDHVITDYKFSEEELSQLGLENKITIV